MREKLIELIRDAKFDVDRICAERDWCDGCPAAYGEGDCKEAYIADHLIANDVVIGVHAHWEDGSAIQNGKEVYQSIDCSHCEEVFKIESETREYWKARFKVCPFCGAVMDGGNKDASSKEIFGL